MRSMVEGAATRTMETYPRSPHPPYDPLHARAGLRRSRRTVGGGHRMAGRSEEHTSELQSLLRISYAVYCLNKNHNTNSLLNNSSANFFLLTQQYCAIQI